MWIGLIHVYNRPVWCSRTQFPKNDLDITTPDGAAEFMGQIRHVEWLSCFFPKRDIPPVPPSRLRHQPSSDGAQGTMPFLPCIYIYTPPSNAADLSF